MMTAKQIEAIIKSERRRIARNKKAVEDLRVDSYCCRESIDFWTSELRRVRAAEKKGVSRGKN